MKSVIKTYTTSLLGVLASALLITTLQSSPAIELITRDFTGQQSAKPSIGSTFLLGADGRLVVFSSSGTNVVVNDTNAVRDVFVYDRWLQSNVWSTVGSRWIGSQQMLAEGSSPGHLTPDSRYLVFTSSATGFVSGVTFPVLIDHLGAGGGITYETIGSQVYVRDLWSNATVIASVSTDGMTAANDRCFGARISNDGRFVAFKSRATNLVALPDGNGHESDIFCRDLVTGTTEVITLSPSGDQTLDRGTEDLKDVSMSTNGQYFSFETKATNVLSGRIITNGTSMVYWRDRLAGTNVLVSDTLDGVLHRYSEGSLSDLSADGRHVCFATYNTNIVTGVTDTNGSHDVFLRDMATGEAWMVTRTTNNLAAGGINGQFNGNGNYLLFLCATTAVVPGVTDGNAFGSDLFIHDLAMRTNGIVTLSQNGTTSGNQGPQGTSRISDNGRFVLFMSNATNLIAGTTSPSPRYYVRDVEAGKTLNVLHLPPYGPGPGYADGAHNISADGRMVAFLSLINLDHSVIDSNNSVDLFAAPLYPPQFLATTPSGVMTAEGVGGATYALEASTDLFNWTSINTNTADAQGVFNTADPQPATGPHRFYRLLWQ